MQFYSGFALQEDAKLFKNVLKDTQYSVAGFSYGAIHAVEYAYQRIQNNIRIDRVQLFSPAFFNTQSERFKVMQLRAYEKNAQAYLRKFISNCYHPSTNLELLSWGPHTKDQLHELLFYTWQSKKLEVLTQHNVAVDVYLGAQDAIIDAQACEAFFAPFAVVHVHKNRGHFLLNDKGEYINE